MSPAPSGLPLPTRLGGSLGVTAPAAAPAPYTIRPASAPVYVPPPLPVELPPEPEDAWKLALGVLTPHQREVVLENAAFVSFDAGTLALVVRVEQWRPVVRESLQEVDFVSVLPGFRRFELRRGDEGQTGREARNEADERRNVAAREAVVASAMVARLVALLGGRVEFVEASRLDEGDRSSVSEESDE